MTDRLSKRSPLLAEILRYINDGNYERAGDVWSFGIGHGSSRAHSNQDEAVFQKMRRLVYDHVARTVAIQRTSLANPPAVDSLAEEFSKLMDELTPQTREALGQAFVPIATGQDLPIPGAAPEAEGELDAGSLLRKRDPGEAGWNRLPRLGARPHGPRNLA